MKCIICYWPSVFLKNHASEKLTTRNCHHLRLLSLFDVREAKCWGQVLWKDNAINRNASLLMLSNHLGLGCQWFVCLQALFWTHLILRTFCELTPKLQKIRQITCTRNDIWESCFYSATMSITFTKRNYYSIFLSSFPFRTIFYGAEFVNKLFKSCTISDTIPKLSAHLIF